MFQVGIADIEDKVTQVSRVKLKGGNLRGVDLSYVELFEANLEGTNVAPGQLFREVTFELEGATMPDGTKHE